MKPIKAIRGKCIDCAHDLKGVRECKEDNCPLHELRMGKGGGTRLKKIRLYCLWCTNKQPVEVAACPSIECPLWHYRSGKRPHKTVSIAKNPSITHGLKDEQLKLIPT